MGKQSKQSVSRDLIRRYQSGDEQSLKQLIRIFHPKLLGYIRFQTGDTDAAEDIAQECWYTIIDQLKTLKIRISFEAWALSIAKRKSVDHIRNKQRSRKRNQVLVDDAEIRAGSESRIENEKTDRLEILKEGIKLLPDTQKIVMRLFYLENLSLNEIADLLKISKGTVKSRLFNAREELKSLINQKER